MQAYWIRFADGHSPAGCRIGCGVTACHPADVRHILVENSRTADYLDQISSIEPIAYEDIEENHVRPNMGSHLRRGIWYPNGI